MGYLKKLGHKLKSGLSKGLTSAGGFLKTASSVAERGMLAADIMGIDTTPYGLAAQAGIGVAGAIGDTLTRAGQALGGSKTLSHGVGVVSDAMRETAGLIEPYLN